MTTTGKELDRKPPNILEEQAKSAPVLDDDGLGPHNEDEDGSGLPTAILSHDSMSASRRLNKASWQPDPSKAPVRLNVLRKSVSYGFWANESCRLPRLRRCPFSEAEPLVSTGPALAA
jgi:hypothetical protein